MRTSLTWSQLVTVGGGKLAWISTVCIGASFGKTSLHLYHNFVNYASVHNMASFDKAQDRGQLSMVATPIGNLEDITLRALRILKEADVVACEDTRVTKKLLSHYDIHVATVSFHANSGKAGFDKIVKLLAEGKSVALVSDAGTPGVSDPGLELVSIVRERLPDIKIETIPGASALTA